MALKKITIQNFVIVDSLELNLSSGFTVLTGETGAGKSILVDALQFALGSRADIGVVRDGSDKTSVCAEFDCPTHIKPWLKEVGFEAGDSLILRRTLDNQGKSRSWINGIAVTASQLKAVGSKLLDIHGQHAWQSLTRPESVRKLLDDFASTSADEVTKLWTLWRSSQKMLEQARQDQVFLERERERLQWQISEVDKLAPSEGEWDELELQHTRLSHAQVLMECAQGALQLLQNDDVGVLHGLTQIQSRLDAQQHLEPEFLDFSGTVTSIRDQVADLAHSLQTYLRRTDVDPERLLTLDSRISLWMSLARRYKRQPKNLPALLLDWKTQMQQLNAAADIERLQLNEAESAKLYQAATQMLSQARNKAAPKLSKAITQAMQGLGMEGGKFEVSVTKAQEPSSYGIDEVFFLVAGHPGMTPKPIGKIASGGELSRISLAIAVATSEIGLAPTLIFDEVDSGVGGAVGETVGRLMQQLGSERQVLAVTHLPQVAACARHHLKVSKRKKSKGTTSTVLALRQEQRSTEIARMLGGESLTETTLAHAREMLHNALHTSSLKGS